MLFKERKEGNKGKNVMFYSRIGCRVETSLYTELVVTVTKSPLLLMSQIFSNDSGALIHLVRQPR